MRQCAVDKPERNTLSFHVLLAHTCRHLRYVDETTLRPSGHHHLDIIGVGEGALCVLSCHVTCPVQARVDLGLKALHQGSPRLRLQLVVLRLLNEPLHLSLGVGDHVVDLCHRLRVSNCVTNSHCEAMLEQPVVHNRLNVIEEEACSIGPAVHPDHVHETACRGPQCPLTQRPTHELAILDEHLGVTRRDVPRLTIAVPPGIPGVVRPGGDDETEDLLPRPERLGLENSWLGHHPVPVLNPHEHIHENVLGEERITLREDSTPQKGVLDDSNHGLVCLRGDDHLGHHHKLDGLGSSLEGLGHVHVHLIPVEVGIVR
mmetsp:Transcript_4551/g.11871  ORF Transcript_4551/g.11871 Transcript_4551/m.11871 type:complete len:316 (-) Transcript_4551:1057-2004(-)